MKSRIRNILIALFSITSALLYSQCQVVEDFNSFNTTGMSTTIEWAPMSSEAVVCHSSDWQPSFFVNTDTLLNVKITGEIYVSSSTNDDDFVGFVFGYKSPTIGTASNDNHFYLFDWKKVGQHAPDEYGGYLAKEGYNLSYAKGLIPGDENSTYQFFWGHEETENFIPIDHLYGGNHGWEYNTTYEFELIYTFNKIIISINGEEIFNVDGCFPAGLFGLYSFSQNGTVYRNVKYEQYYEISFQTDEDTYCEERPVSFHFLDANCSYPPSSITYYEWNFNDGTTNSNELNPEHIFFDPGTFDVDLYITNINGCIDTLTTTIFIEPKPLIESHPEDVQCIVGDIVTFTVEAEYDESYQWYYQSKEMNSWKRMSNNGYFSGVNTSELKVFNVRPAFDEMKFRCHVDGVCFNPVVTQYAQIFITAIPVRADLSTADPDQQICESDSTILIISLEEPYQIKRAHLRILYDSLAFQVSDYTSYLDNMNFEWEIGTSYIDIDIYVTEAINMDQAIIAAINLNSIADQENLTSFNWDPEFTYFIDENQDTILKVLNDSEIHIYQTTHIGFADTIHVCKGESIDLNQDIFPHIQWSTGEQDAQILFEEEGDYWVQVIDYHNCSSIDSFNIVLEELPIAVNQIILAKPYFCSFDDTISFTVEGGSGSSLNFQYGDQTFIDLFTLPKTYQFLNAQETNDLEVFWSNSCGNSEVINTPIEVYPQAIPYVEILSDIDDIGLGDMVTFTAYSEDAGENPSYTWMVDEDIIKEGAENFYRTDKLGQNQKVTVALFSDEHCIFGADSVETFLHIDMHGGPDFYIPGLVTPNGDGFNDSFKVIFRRSNITDFNLQIFDLRGRLVFQTNDVFHQWTGSTGNPSGAPEIFTYYITYKTEALDTKEIKGKFLLKK